MLEPFALPFVQRGLVEVLLLSVAAGVLGTWIVLRGLAFYSHAVGTAAFPGLVLAGGLGISPQVGAFAVAVVFAGTMDRLSRDREEQYDSLTALALVGALVVGVILASDVFHSGSSIDTLLFGSLLLIGARDIALASAAAVVTVAATSFLGPRWLAAGFDPTSARSLAVRTRASEWSLLVLIALAVTASLSAIGALLATALFVIPAATTRLWFRRVLRWQIATVALAALEGTCGLWLSVHTNAPPGATIATLAGAVFAASTGVRLAAGSRHLRSLTRLTAAGAALGLVAAACAGGGAPGTDDGRMRVVATTTQIADWVRNVGGDRVEVHQILQPNTDPHDYEPRPADVETTATAAIVFENGDNLDRWMANVISEAGGRPTVVVLGNHVPVRLPGETAGPEASRYDPHWWHDPANAQAAVRAIRDALARKEPGGRATFERNASSYLTQLTALDRGIASCFARLPATERKLVTDHDAFNYFAHRYGIRVIGAIIPSQTTQAQPSAGDVVKLVDLIKREGVKAVFPESSLNPNLAQTIARETGASSDVTLYGDTLGPAGSPGATYLAMERANADAMLRGFTGGKESCTMPGMGP